MELGKVPSCTDKEKDRKKPKEDESDSFGRDKRGKEKKKKKQARKDGGDWVSVDRRKAASAVFPARAPYLIRVA